MLNQKQITDLTLYFLEEIQSIISFKVTFSIQDSLNFPPEESIFFAHIEPMVNVWFSTTSRNSLDSRVFLGLYKESEEKTKELIHHVLDLEERAKRHVDKGYDKPVYDISQLTSSQGEEFSESLLLVSIQSRFKEHVSKLYSQLEKLEDSEFKSGILDAIESHVRKQLVKIKHELTDSGQSCSFQIDDKVIHAIHLCIEDADIKGHHYLRTTRSTLEQACFVLISKALKDFLEDLNTLYPNSLVTKTDSSPTGNNDHFKWNSWSHQYLIQYYCNGAAAKGLDDVDLPDFVNLLSGAEHKPQTLQWTGSKSVLSAIFRDLHLGSGNEVVDVNVHPILSPLQKVMKLQGLFAQTNDDPKSSDSRLEIPIHSQTSSGKDILNQQLFETAGAGVKMKAIPHERLKPHHKLVLDLLGIPYTT